MRNRNFDCVPVFIDVMFLSLRVNGTHLRRSVPVPSIVVDDDLKLRVFVYRSSRSHNCLYLRGQIVHCLSTKFSRVLLVAKYFEHERGTEGRSDVSLLYAHNVDVCGL